MVSLTSGLRIYLAPGATDMRKSFYTLAAAARSILDKDPYSGQVFVFCGRRRDLIKILYWDGTGFWLLAKRLARGTFSWPSARPGQTAIELRGVELQALLGGLEFDGARWRSWVPSAVRSR